MRNILIFVCAILSSGCTEKTPSSVPLKNKDTLIYKNNTLNKECASFLEKSISGYLMCNSWKIQTTDINDIVKFSKKYQPNFIATRHLMTPIEVDLNRVIEKDNTLYILYPNGFFVVTEKRNYNYKDQYTEINQSYVCLSAECEKYFLWKFVDEEIIEKNPNFEEENPRSDDIADNLLKKNINAQPHLILKTDKVDINGRVCHFKKFPTDKVKDCLYYIANDTLYLYHKYDSEEQSVVHKLQLKKH